MSMWAGKTAYYGFIYLTNLFKRIRKNFKIVTCYDITYFYDIWSIHTGSLKQKVIL